MWEGYSPLDVVLYHTAGGRGGEGEGRGGGEKRRGRGEEVEGRGGGEKRRGRGEEGREGRWREEEGRVFKL